MASARLRKAFRYPDSGDEDAREELDEEGLHGSPVPVDRLLSDVEY